MSDNLTPGCLVHHNSQHIQVRKDFFDLCAYNKADFNQALTKGGKRAKDEPNQECMAKILRVLETLTNREKENHFIKAEYRKTRGQKPPKELKEHPIELSYSFISNLLYNTYGESVIRNSIAELLRRNYIKRYQERKNGTPSYVLDVKVVQAALNKQAQEAVSDDFDDFEVSKSIPQGPKSTAENSISTAESSKSTPQGPKSTPIKISNEMNPKNDCKNDSPNKSATLSDQKPEASSPSSIPSQSLSEELPPPGEEKSEEKTKLTEEEQHIYDLACQELFKTSPPEIKPTVKEQCAKLAEDIKTQEQLTDLAQYSREEQGLHGKKLYLGNLVKALDGWRQTRRAARVGPSLQSQQSSTPYKSLNALRDLRTLNHGGK